MASPFAAGGNAGQDVVGAFRAEDVTLDFGGTPAERMIVQSIQFTCTRSVNFLYEIGSAHVYYVGNRRQGQCQMTRVVGGSDAFKNLVCQYGNLCEPKDLTIKVEPKGTTGICLAGNVQYVLKQATLNSLGASVTANEIVINEQLGFIFADVDYGCAA